jgi:hypothetical protein
VKETSTRRVLKRNAMLRRGWRYVSGWLPAAQAAQVEAMIATSKGERYEGEPGGGASGKRIHHDGTDAVS